MTTTPIDTSGITVPTSKPTKPFAVPYVRPEKPGATGIVVPAFKLTPIAPKPAPVSAATCSGEWPAALDTLETIKADIDAQGPDAKKDVQAHILIAACIARGIDAGFAIRAVGIELGFNGYHIGKLLNLKPKTRPSPWQKGPDGRYRLI
jgi:hypothetical protein